LVTGFQLTKKLDSRELTQAIALSAELTAALVPGGELMTRMQATRDQAVAGKFGENVEVSDASGTSIAVTSRIHIDLGGDDQVSWQRSPQWGETQVFLDFGGNDLYVDDRRAIAAGQGSAGIFIDLAGNDQYLSQANALGFGLVGCGVLWDVAGNDSYRGAQFSQGVGCLGLGFLIDGNGNDRYDASSYGQAVGLPSGLGALIDGGGDDVYLCTGRDGSPYGDAGEYAGWGQGIGFGFRQAAAGGVGALLDLGGRDHYRVGQFGLGCGYYYGIGVVWDHQGADHYECSRYGLATAAHYAVGIVCDDQGDDSYDATRPAAVASLGGVWDLGVALFVDSAGDDLYRGDVYFLGAAAQTGYGLFWDKQGTDCYLSKSQQGVPAAGYLGGATYGGGRLARNLALFWDQGKGDDLYLIPNRRNAAHGVDGEFGAWCDE
jgi:hypothetical protein